jgi:hypothetical protein
MEQDFDNLLTSLLESYDADEKKDVNAFLVKKQKELGLSDQSISSLNETNEWIDAFDKNAKDLDDAEKSGRSRKSWMKSRIDDILEGKTDEEKTNVANIILNSNEEIINQSLSKEE